jgi:hypothetical protein
VGQKSVWKEIEDRGLGKPVLLITKINHYKGDCKKESYTAKFPEEGDFDTSVKSKNRFRLAVLLRDVIKQFVKR